ncbi:PREDICTED: uncharacterized protein LOC109219458 [Nicotiana attenuata]|uniref:uncharacterized protein LOC109219458 n=1 Tax=Nicotiana attenuata TaxID=49451 RepID=UPI000905149E|nr:PREDICTED: uncharacterized protein LOC109219458 [Nicotiana attenuata]
MVTVRSIIALAAAKHWLIFQMNVYIAFLNGDLLEKVYMHITEGFCRRGETKKVNKTRSDLQTSFKMKDLGELKFFLGIEFARSKEGMVMNQRKYAMELISKSGLGGAKPAGTQLEMNQKLTSTEYDNWMKVNRDDEMLKDPSSFQSTNKLTAYCDSDWGACLQTRRLVTSYIVKFGNTLVSWRSKKQDTITRSSAEAEFRSMATCAAEVTWLIGLFEELGVKQKLHVDICVTARQPFRLLQVQFFMRGLNI